MGKPGQVLTCFNLLNRQAYKSETFSLLMCKGIYIKIPYLMDLPVHLLKLFKVHQSPVAISTSSDITIYLGSKQCPSIVTFYYLFFFFFLPKTAFINYIPEIFMLNLNYGMQTNTTWPQTMFESIE